MITTTKGMMDPATLRKSEGVVDDDREFTVWTEYWLDDELVHRSVAVELKEGIQARGASANFSED